MSWLPRKPRTGEVRNPNNLDTPKKLSSAQAPVRAVKRKTRCWKMTTMRMWTIESCKRFSLLVRGN